MEQSEEKSSDVKKTKEKSEESFAWDEWTVIADAEGANSRSDSQPSVQASESANELSYSDIDDTSDAEEACEPCDAQPKEAIEAALGESPNDRNDESDGVSVISESEHEEGASKDLGNRIVSYRKVLCRTEDKRETNRSKEVASCTYLLIACSVVVAVGICLGSRFLAEYKISKDVDYATIKMENDKLVDRMEDLMSVKGILEEIKSSLIPKAYPDSENVEKSWREMTSKSHSIYVSENIKLLDSVINEPGTTLFERLQTVLRTVCLILEDIRRVDTNTESDRSSCDDYSSFDDLVNLRIILKSVIGEMDDSARSENQRFMKNIDFRIRSVGETLVSDLSSKLEKVSLKNEQKMEKIVHQMKERLCLLRNTMSSDNKIRQSLESNETFVKSCEKITSAFDSRRQEKWKMENPEFSSVKKNAKNSRFSTADRSISKDQNSTKTNNRTTGYRENVARAKKCYGNRESFVSDGNSEGTCSILIAPPPRSSTWKSTKYQTSSELPISGDETKNEDFARQKKAAKTFGKKRSIDDDRASKISKKKMARGETNKRERNFSPNEKKNDYPKRSMPVKPRVDLNSDIKYEREYPVKSTVRSLGTKRFDKPAIDKSEKESNARENGQWQFTRSQIRDQMRKDELIGNWYFDRVKNRKSSRTNINDMVKDRR